MKRLTKEEFIQKARTIHGEKYDYSKVNYVNNSTKVTIVCPIHGDFLQTPNHHLLGQGCRKCAGTEKMDSNSFVEKAVKVHGDRFDYSKVNYVNARTKVSIICHIHGEFQQNPNRHLMGDGCIKCAGLEKKNTEIFIRDAIHVHGDKYEYSKVEYFNSSKKVKIICPTHGEFWQSPNCHLKGSGCPVCGGTQRLTLSNFIKTARAIHGNKYDYSKVEYINNRTSVCIICPEHGEFWQKPDSHMAGSGCSLCAYNAISESKLKDLNTFIKEAKAVHGDKYDYSRVKYTGNCTKVCIICPEHGMFWQTPHNHLSGKGCPKCVGLLRTTDEFISMAKGIHGNKYDYSKTVYHKSNKKVCIVCLEHGEFWQTPHSHLKGSGCPLCYGTPRLTNEEFIKRSRLVHGTKYGYNNVEYKSAFDRVCITCPKHGDFWQVAHAHLRGSGCPACNTSTLEDMVRDGLSKNSIQFLEQKTFSWLRNKKSMRLDFFLPDHNIAIECQGVQHFKPVESFGGEDAFKETQLRDTRKMEKCRTHGIKILYFSNLGIEYPYPVYEDLDEIIQFIKSQLIL